MIRQRDIAVASFVVLAALALLLPHPWNFGPVGAMALFGGAHFRSRYGAYGFPLAALALSDAILGFYPNLWLTYASFCIFVWLGTLLRNSRNPLSIASAALAGSVSFFIITNFGVWASQSLYPKTWAGLQSCYIAGLPFFQNALLGDAFFTGILFGSFALAERRFPILQGRPASV